MTQLAASANALVPDLAASGGAPLATARSSGQRRADAATPSALAPEFSFPSVFGGLIDGFTGDAAPGPASNSEEQAPTPGFRSQSGNKFTKPQEAAKNNKREDQSLVENSNSDAALVQVLTPQTLRLNDQLPLGYVIQMPQKAPTVADGGSPDVQAGTQQATDQGGASIVLKAVSLPGLELKAQPSSIDINEASQSAARETVQDGDFQQQLSVPQTQAQAISPDAVPMSPVEQTVSKAEWKAPESSVDTGQDEMPAQTSPSASGSQAPAADLKREAKTRPATPKAELARTDSAPRETALLPPPDPKAQAPVERLPSPVPADAALNQSTGKPAPDERKGAEATSVSGNDSRWQQTTEKLANTELAFSTRVAAADSDALSAKTNETQPEPLALGTPVVKTQAKTQAPLGGLPTPARDRGVTLTEPSSKPQSKTAQPAPEPSHEPTKPVAAAVEKKQAEDSDSEPPVKPATTMAQAPSTISSTETAPMPSGTAKAQHVEKTVEPQLPPETPSTQSSPAIRDFSLRLSGAGHDKVEVNVVETAGEIRVAVRSADPELTSSLQQGIGDLVSKLDDRGVKAQTWKPSGESSGETSSGGTSVSVPAARPESGPGNQSGGQNGQQQFSEQGSQERRRQQQVFPPPRRNKPDLLREIDGSFQTLHSDITRRTV